MNTTFCSFDSNLTADLGAQYLTRLRSQSAAVQAAFDELAGAGIVETFGGKIQNERAMEDEACKYVAPAGFGSVVDYFLQGALGCSIPAS